MYRFKSQPVQGVVNTATYLQDGRIEFLTPDGNVDWATYEETKAICFVSEVGRYDLFSVHTQFERRPKLAGLWARFTLSDGDHLDGILPHNLIEWPIQGYLVTPPKAGANRQRVFLPRPAVIATELRGVMGVPVPTTLDKAQMTPEAAQGQIEMFDS